MSQLGNRRTEDFVDGSVMDPSGVALPPGSTMAADGVEYLPSGTGAVARTVQDKLREFVSVKDFGAVGDGVADDTAAIQAAINTGKTVRGVKGDIYKTQASLTFPAVSGNWQIFDLDNAVIKPVGSHDAFVFSGAGFQFRNTRIDGSLCTGTILASSGIVKEFIFEDVVIQSSAGNAITMADPYTGRFNRVSVLNAVARSFLLYSATPGTPVNSIWVENCNFDGSTYVGDVFALEGAAGCYVRGCSFQNNASGSNDIALRNTVNAGISGVYIEDNYFETGASFTGNGIYVAGLAPSTAVGVVISKNFMQISKQPINLGPDVNPDVTITRNTFISITGSPSYAVGWPGGYVPNCYGNDGRLADLDTSFTPAITFGGGNTGIAYAVQSGTARRTENQINGQVRIQLSNKGSSTGSAVITGMPMAAGLASKLNMAVSPVFNNFASLSGGMIGRIGPSATGINLSTYTASATVDVAETNFTNSSEIYLTFNYNVD